MVVGLLGNKSPDSNRFTLVTPKPENGVRLQATLGNQNPTGLPVGAVRYRVTPYFESDELVARGVLLEAQSIETTDISFCVWCYNVQPGIIIDYKTGDSRVDEHYAVPVDDSNDGQSVAGMSDPSNASATDNNAVTATSPGMGEDKDIASETTYVLNTNTLKFHYVDCPSVKQMATHNMEQTSMTRDEIIAAGYSPCGNCKP